MNEGWKDVLEPLDWFLPRLGKYPWMFPSSSVVSVVRASLVDFMCTYHWVTHALILWISSASFMQIKGIPFIPVFFPCLHIFPAHLWFYLKWNSWFEGILVCLIHTLKSKRREGCRVSSTVCSPCPAISTLNDSELWCFLLPQFTHLCLDIFGGNTDVKR